MVTAKRTGRGQTTMQGLSGILMLSAWGFVIVICSFAFMYAGYWIDKALNTAPSFMLGLFMLALFLCVGRLYQEAWLKRKK
jgi:F0F1-type ATP synthase assembly protein I